MTKRIEIKIGVDGTINAETKGIVGQKCTNYVSILEDLLDSEAISSKFTDDYLVSEANDNTFMGVDDGTI